LFAGGPDVKVVIRFALAISAGDRTFSKITGMSAGQFALPLRARALQRFRRWDGYVASDHAGNVQAVGEAGKHCGELDVTINQHSRQGPLRKPRSMPTLP
jgi:hypothetical protein